MPTKNEAGVARDGIIRIPVTLKDENDRRLFLAVKQAVEKREGRSLSWAAVTRIAFRSQAAIEGIKCK